MDGSRLVALSGGGVAVAGFGGAVVAGSALAEPAGPRVVPVGDHLARFFPWGGIRRGGTVVVRGSTALLCSLLAGVTAAGGWVAVVGVPALGVVAAGELGVEVERLALVPHPGGDPVSVVAALVDGFDAVAVARGRIGDAQARRLSARARARGAALLSTDPWPGADTVLSCSGSRWTGLGSGHGHLRDREAIVRAEGRGAPVTAPVPLSGKPVVPAT